MDKMTTMATELFGWISDDQGDEVFFRNACIGLMRDVLRTMERTMVRYKEDEQKRKFFPMLFKVNTDSVYKRHGFIGVGSPDFYSFPEKTQKDVYDYIMACCQMSGFNELFEEIVTKKL